MTKSKRFIVGGTRQFVTLTAAINYRNRVFRKEGIVLAVEKLTPELKKLLKLDT
jgi:hypothetical protein